MLTRLLPSQLSALREYSQFIVCKLSYNTDEKKLLKLPLNHMTFREHNPLDPSIWLDYDDAVEKLMGLGNNYGVGFVLTENDPFFCLDMDGCLYRNALKPEYATFVDRLDGCAIEVSQSLEGLHVWGQSQEKLSHTTHSTFKVANKPVELYSKNRFIFLTGEVWLNRKGSVSYDAAVALNALISDYFTSSVGHNDSHDWTETPHTDWNGYHDDEKLIASALKSKSVRHIFTGKASFFDLWTPNVGVLSREFPSMKGTEDYDASRVDAALAQHLAFWTGNHCERMFQLMQKSELKREKWEREDYLRNTILNAVKRQREFHNLGKLSKKEGAQDRIFFDSEKIYEEWKNCIYVKDINRVFMPNGMYLSPEVFRNSHGGCCFQTSPIGAEKLKTTTNAWNAYNESLCFRPKRVDTTCFLPQNEFQEILMVNGLSAVNTWKKPEIPRKRGSAAIFEDLVHTIFPLGDDAVILLSYFAAIVQYLGVKFDWAVYMQGVQGTGKTTLILFLQKIIGLRYVHETRAGELNSRFNQWMIDKLLITINEINIANDPLIYEVIKNLVTGHLHEIEGKGVNKINKQICCNYIFTGNYKDGLPLVENERRFAVFFTKQQRKAELIRDGLTPSYFTRIYDFMDNKEGVAIVGNFLSEYKIPDKYDPTKDARRAPETSAMQEAIEFGKPHLEQEIQELVEQEQIGFRGGWISGNYLDNILRRWGFSKLSFVHRNQLVLNLGYIKHPGLPEGRVPFRKTVQPDNMRVRLYCVKNHKTVDWKDVDAILADYTRAQVA